MEVVYALWLLLAVGCGSLLGFLFARHPSPGRRIKSQNFAAAEFASAFALRDTQPDLISWIFCNTPITIWSTDEKLRLGDAYAPLIEKRSGVKMETIRGLTLHELFQTDDDNHPALAAHRRALKGEAVSYETEWAGRTFAARVHPWPFDGTPPRGCRGVAIDVTEIRLKDEKLHHLGTELERAHADLQRFAYAVSHDFKEPVRMISSFLRLLETKFQDKLDEEAQEYIRHSIGGAKRLHTLVDSLLNFCSTANAGVTKEACDLNALVGQIVSDVAMSVQARQASLNVKELPTVQADPTLLSQVFRNLISNALKFSGDKKPALVIETKPHREGNLVLVRDNGIGIPSEYLAKIFVPFVRLHSRDEYEGDGIGLSLCARIMERHGGKIWAESEPARGSTFFLLFPKPPTPA